MATESKKTSRKASEGSILIFVLWVLAVLSLLGLGLGYAASLDLRLVGYQRERLTALYLAKAGYVRALAELERDPTPEVDSYLDPWAHNPEAFQQTTLGEGRFSVSYSLRGEDGSDGVVYGVIDEDRKVNINTASKDILGRLPGMTEEIVDALLDWRQKHSDFDMSKERPFRVLEDLLLVDGMTEELVQSLQPFVTVYTDGKVNLNTAPREVLNALGLGAGLVTKLLRFRTGLDGIHGTKDDQSFTALGSAQHLLNTFDPLTPEEAAQFTNLITQNRLKVTSAVFRIRSTGAVRDGKITRSVEAIVQRVTDASRAPALLAWHEY